MIPPLLIAGLWLAQAGPASPRALLPDGEVRDSLAGGESVVFSIDVPADTAARVLIRQEGIDLYPTLRRAGSSLPEHGLDLAAGPAGEEPVFPPVEAAPATWHILLKTALPRAERGDYTISLELAPADDRARAVADARQRHQAASDTSWRGDGQANREALVAYAAAAEAALAAGDVALAAESTYQCARTQDVLGDTPGAIERQLRALELFRSAGRKDREARVLNRLGDLSRKEGDVGNSERYFGQALPLARDARDLVAVADILNNSGLLKLTLGRFEEAIEQLESAIPLAQTVGSANVEGALLNNVSEAYASLGEYQRAIEGYGRGLEVVGRMNLPRRTGRSLFMLAATLFDSGDPARAEETVRRALEALERSGDKTYTGEALGLLGRLLEARGEHEQATATFAKALSLLREANQRYAIARVLTLWADAEIGRGEADAPLPRLEEALSLFRAIADPSSESFALYLKALALERQQRLDEATDAVAAAIERVEALRGGIVRSELRASYLSTVRSYYDLHVDLLQRRGRTTAAFEMSERSRARTLLEGLSESAARIRKGVDPELLARQRKLQAELNAKEQLRAQLADQASPRAQALGKTIERLVGEMQEVQGRIRASSPGYWALKTPTAVGVERVQKSLLDEQSALVEYHLGPKRSYAWVVDRSAVTVHELPPSARVGELARRYHELLSRDTDPLKPAERERLAADVADAGRRLSAVAWAPVEARVRGKRLLIVADGALQYVPFAALPGGTGEPLLAEHEIAYLPSASVFDSLRRGSRRIATGSAAVFADPVFARDDPRVAGAGLASAPDAAADVGVSRSALRAAGGGFPRLRFSRREAETIAAAAGARTFEALDFSASKKTLLERDLRGYRILHFATHGVLNTQHPELSGLVFSLVDKAGKPVDGFLRLHEIYNLDLDADLVVLSACRTALGKEVHGEGLIGLTRGFLYAGASRIVSSVWNVDDRASALLMSRFYTAMLAKGASPAAALREAQLSLLREPRWANPHYWAAFGLQGEWR